MIEWYHIQKLLSFAKKAVRFKEILFIEIQYFECSAFTGDGVDEVFKSASKSIKSKVDDGKIQTDTPITSMPPIIIQTPSSQSNQRSCSYC